eukprot:5709184-Amphidinium_carterae.1
MVLSVRGTPWLPRPTTAPEAKGEELRIRVAADPLIKRDEIPEARGSEAKSVGRTRSRIPQERKRASQS